MSFLKVSISSTKIKEQSIAVSRKTLYLFPSFPYPQILNFISEVIIIYTSCTVN